MTILCLLSDGLLNTNSLLLLSTYITLNTYKYDLRYYIKLFIIGLIIDILFTDTILLNTFIIIIIGYLNKKILDKYNSTLTTSIIIYILNIIIYKSILTISFWLFLNQKIIYNYLLEILINIPIIILFNIKEIIVKIKHLYKKQFPTKIYLLSLKERIKRKSKLIKKIAIIIFLLIISVLIYNNETIIKTNTIEDIKINIKEYSKSKDNLSNINPEIIGNIIYTNINLYNKDYLTYEITIKNNKHNIIRLKDITYEKNDLIEIKTKGIDNHILILPNHPKTFFLTITSTAVIEKENIKIKLDFINL